MFSKIIFNYRKTKQENNKELLEDIEKRQNINKKNIFIGNMLKDKLNTNKIQNVREIINKTQLENNALKQTVSAPSVTPFNINRITEPITTGKIVFLSPLVIPGRINKII